MKVVAFLLALFIPTHGQFASRNTEIQKAEAAREFLRGIDFDEQTAVLDEGRLSRSASFLGSFSEVISCSAANSPGNSKGRFGALFKASSNTEIHSSPTSPVTSNPISGMSSTVQYKIVSSGILLFNMSTSCVRLCFISFWLGSGNYLVLEILEPQV